MNHLASLVAAGALVATCLAPSPAGAQARPDSTVSARTDSSALNVEVVIQRVLEQNPTIAAARSAWAESRAGARQAGALDDPMLDFMVAPRSLGSSSVPSTYRIEVTQAFPIFGHRGLRRRAAEADARTMGWDLRTAQLDPVREARSAYAQYWQIGRAIALNRELNQLLPEVRRVTLAKYAAGQVGQHEPLQMDTELAMLDH